MRIPETLNDTQKHWDFYREFAWDFPWRAHHGARGPVVLFETGELVVYQTGAHHRTPYPSLDIEVTATNAPDLPKMVTPDGRPVLPTWLNICGLQEIVIDYTTRRVVGADQWITGITPGIPERLRLKGGKVYFPAPGAVPVSPTQITVRPPATQKGWASEDEIKRVREFTAAAKAFVALNGRESKVSWSAPPEVSDLMSADNIGELSEGKIHDLATIGCARPVHRFDHLVLA